MLTRRAWLARTGAALAALPAALHAETPTRRRARQRAVPSRAQVEWQRDELALFLHFGMNTFTDREWGDGTEAPSVFNPSALDTTQWATAAAAAGARAMVLTAKHHDGFCLWPSAVTSHSVAHSPWRSGRGDVVREFVDSCRAARLKVGLYLSPWDRHEPSYGDTDRYNAFYLDQLTELLTRYGRIDEVWFDGANGEGPNGRKPVYDWPRIWAHTKRLQPAAVIFSDAGPDVRWIGNENGVAGDPNWSPVDPDVVPVPGTTGAAAMRMLQHGDPHGRVWRPGETDVSIRPGWFHHAAEDGRVRSVDNLVNLYFTSVGRNSKLLLNVPPTREGRLHMVDVERLAGMRRALDQTFAHNLVPARATWRASGPSAAVGTVDLGRAQRLSIVDLGEHIEDGQRVVTYTVEGSMNHDRWTVLSTGTTIGYRKLDRLASPIVSPIEARYLRVTLAYLDDADGRATPVRIAAYA